MLKSLTALIAGGLFGFGLAIAQLLDPSKIQGFLDITGDWNIGPLIVIGIAVLVYGLGSQLITRRSTPIFDNHWHLPTLRSIDRRLIGGSILFGIGWGLVGYCPGPALASLSYGGAGPLYFVCAMFLGAFFCPKPKHESPKKV